MSILRFDSNRKPSSSPSLEEDEGFSDWTQRRERQRQQRLQELRLGGEEEEDEEDNLTNKSVPVKTSQASTVSASRHQRREWTEMDRARTESERRKEREEEARKEKEREEERRRREVSMSNRKEEIQRPHPEVRLPHQTLQTQLLEKSQCCKFILQNTKQCLTETEPL